MFKLIDKWAFRIVAGFWVASVVLALLLTPFAACLALWHYIFGR